MDNNDLKYLNEYPNEIVNDIPVTTCKQTLPFEKLEWENFEKFCYQLGLKELNLDGHYHGRKGQKQDGIDIWFQKGNEIQFWQIKKYKNFGVNDLKAAGKKFLDGELVDKTTSFTLCVSDYLDHTDTVIEISNQTKIFHDKGITFKVLNSDKLTIAAKKYPELIKSFFGKQWLEAIGIDEKKSDSIPNSNWELDGEKIINGEVYQLGSFNVQFNDDGTLNTEYQLPDGKTSYQKVNISNSTISDNKMPYPIELYKINVPDELIIKIQDAYLDVKGIKYPTKIYNLKWDKKIIAAYDEKGLLKDIHSTCTFSRDDTNKIFKFLSETEYKKSLKKNNI